jgi:hypothetical protein
MVKYFLNFLLLSAGYVNTFAGKAFAALRFSLKLPGTVTAST